MMIKNQKEEVPITNKKALLIANLDELEKPTLVIKLIQDDTRNMKKIISLTQLIVNRVSRLTKIDPDYFCSLSVHNHGFVVRASKTFLVVLLDQPEIDHAYISQ